MRGEPDCCGALSLGSKASYEMQQSRIDHLGASLGMLLYIDGACGPYIAKCIRNLC